MKTMFSKWRSLGALLTLVALFVSPGVLGAHEGHHHQAMGTVKMIHENHLVLTLADEKEQTFVLSEATKYLRGEAEAKREEVVAGERAVVVYEKKDGADHAIEVKLGEKKS